MTRNSSRQNRRSIAIFAVIFVVLLGVAALQGVGVSLRGMFGSKPTPDPFGGMPRVLTDFTVLDIQAIRIGSPLTGDELLLSRAEDGRWTAPDAEGELDGETATLIARTMVLLPYLETIHIKDDTVLADFGFVSQNPLALTVEVLLVDGTTHAVFFGGLTPLQDAFYMIVDDRNEIYLVMPQAVEFLRLQLRNPPINLTTD
jgi:hypothetical protein